MPDPLPGRQNATFGREQCGAALPPMTREQLSGMPGCVAAHVAEGLCVGPGRGLAAHAVADYQVLRDAAAQGRRGQPRFGRQ